MSKGITSVLSGIAGTRVAVIGDLMLDEYIVGDSTRISPEAPEPIIEEQRRVYIPGGAANVAVNIKSLGGIPGLFGILGDDSEGSVFRDSLIKTGVSDDGLVSDSKRPTTRKTRMIARGNQVLRVDRETVEPINVKTEDNFVNAIKKFDAEYLLVSDYAKGMVTGSLMKKLAATGKKVIVDPKSPDFGLYSGAFLIKPNYLEFCRAAGRNRIDKNEIESIAREMMVNFNIRNMLVTLGAEGMALVSPGKKIEFITPRAREVYDVTGAGDTVIAALAAALASGVGLSESCLFAATAAAIVVGKHGTATASPEEISEYVFGASFTSKIVERETLGHKTENLRTAGKKIVFTNGCFDLLHIGHITYLNDAKRLGDILIVGINTDDSVKRLKGDGRPIIPQEQRTGVIAALECVDYAVLFDEDTPLELIKTVKPDILVKGADYTVDGVVGRNFVESYGGKVELIKLVGDASTTGIIDRIKNSR